MLSFVKEPTAKDDRRNTVNSTNTVLLFVGYRRMDRHTVHQNLYNEVRKADKIVG